MEIKVVKNQSKFSNPFAGKVPITTMVGAQKRGVEEGGAIYLRFVFHLGRGEGLFFLSSFGRVG